MKKGEGKKKRRYIRPEISEEMPILTVYAWVTATSYYLAPVESKTSYITQQVLSNVSQTSYRAQERITSTSYRLQQRIIEAVKLTRPVTTVRPTAPTTAPTRPVAPTVRPTTRPTATTRPVTPTLSPTTRPTATRVRPTTHSQRSVTSIKPATLYSPTVSPLSAPGPVPVPPQPFQSKRRLKRLHSKKA